MGLLKRYQDRKTDIFSDEEIDAFVARQRNNKNTIDTEEEAFYFIKFHEKMNSDSEGGKSPDQRLVVPTGSPMRQLWNKLDEYHPSRFFEPLEFMYEKIEETHEILKENFYRKHGENEPFESFDSNQEDLASFMKELDERAREIMELITNKEKYDSGELEEKEESSDEEDVNSKLKKLLFEDGNLGGMGGFDDEAEFEKLLNDYLKRNQVMAEELLAIEDMSNLDISVNKEILSQPADAEIRIKLSRDKVRAWIFVFPPRNSGNGITAETLRKVLSDNDVVYGVNDSEIENIEKNELYFKIIEVAQGIDAQDGANGIVKELFSRNNYEINLKEDENGIIDFKDLDSIKSVHKGDVIAEISSPGTGTDGMQVTGELLKCSEGEIPSVPAGKNVSLSEDKTKLVADIDGELYFMNEQFHVRKLLRILNDVDASTGNIDFTGDVLVEGNVREGFTVKCEGDLRIKGNSEGATLIAGGNVSIVKGMSGGGHGLIKSGGNVVCTYLESCQVNAKKNVRADQISNSIIRAEGYVLATGMNGRIIGGTILGGKGIRANYIGTSFGAASCTSLTVGLHAAYREELSQLRSDMKEIDENIGKLNLNRNSILYMGDNINIIQKILLKKIEIQLDMRNFQKNELAKQIMDLEMKLSEKEIYGEIRCGSLRSVINIDFYSTKCTIKRDVDHLSVFMKDNKTVIKGRDFTQIL